VIYRDRVIHVASWAARFLFDSEQLNQPVSKLSGGERARVLIARLMLEAADVLLLDEPTNDLDIPTLEILEESLLEFPGALILVTHDRYLLDRVSTVVLGLDGEGSAGRFADYSQWEEWRDEKKRPAPKAAKAAETPVAAVAKKKLSYIEAREYEGMEAKIAEAEAELTSRKAALEEPAVMRDGRAVEDAYRKMEEAQASVDALYARWAELEAKLS
jgi:ATP-binding cassette subfamily F protein uup